MTTGVDAVELVKGIAEMDGLIKVVETKQHLETGMGISEIFTLMAFKVVGISLWDLDSIVSMTGNGPDSETPTSGTEAGGDARGVAV